MKIYTFPPLTNEFTLNSVSNRKINEDLYKQITSKKSEIDTVQYKWDSAKKISNDK